MICHKGSLDYVSASVGGEREEEESARGTFCFGLRFLQSGVMTQTS